MHNTKNCGNW